MNNNSSSFCIIDQTRVPSLLFTSPNDVTCVNDYLTLIESKLDTLIQFNVSVERHELKFDHLFISANTCSTGLFYSELDRYKLDFNAFIIRGEYDDNGLISIVKCSLLVNRIKAKVKKICNGKYVTKSKDIQKPKIIQKPKKSVMDDTKQFINNINTDDIKINNKKRFIPTMEDSDTISQCDADESSKNELGIDRPFNTVIRSSVKQVNVNIPDDVSDLDINELEKQLNELQKLKKEEQSKLENMKEEQTTDVENFSKFFDKLNDEKRFARMDKERAHEKKRKYYANKRSYFMMEQDILDDKLEEDKISPFFKNEFKIYRYMNNKNLLDKDTDLYDDADSQDNKDEYELYLHFHDELYPVNKSEDVNEFKPHNYNYLTEEERDKYDDTEPEDKIDEFMNNMGKEDKKYQPLNDILKELGDTDEYSDKNLVSDDNDSHCSEDIPPVDNFDAEPTVFDQKKSNLLDQLVSSINNK